MGGTGPQPPTAPALARHGHPFPRASPAMVAFAFRLPASIFTRRNIQNDPAPIQIFGVTMPTSRHQFCHASPSCAQPPQLPSAPWGASAMVPALGRSCPRSCSQDTRLPGGRDSRQLPVSPWMDAWLWKTPISWARGCFPLTPSPAAGATCRWVRGHGPCVTPECPEPAERLAAGTKNNFKASVGKFREGKCFQTGYTNASPLASPELYISRSTPGGGTGCQPSPCIPGLVPSPLPPSSWGAGRCPVPPTDSHSPSLSLAHVQRQLENSVILLKPP